MSKTRRVMSAVSLIFRLSPIFLQLVMESFQADAEQLCGTRLIVLRGGQGLENEAAFSLGDRHARSEPEFASTFCHAGMAEAARQFMDGQVPARTSNEHALQNIAQLAHIPRPVVSAEGL